MYVCYPDGHCTTIAVARGTNTQQNGVLFHNDMARISPKENEAFKFEDYIAVTGNVLS
jgi:hypothetical protein